jgi:transcription termination factor Rho
MDVCILLDSITRLARAYNLTVQPSGRTLSGGLDPAALHMPKRFFGAARNMREGGSLTILSTALVETGSRMDDVVFEEFKGTGNMEVVLDRSLSEKRIFPAIDLARSSTRRDDLLLDAREAEAALLMHRALSGMKSEDAVERIIDLFVRTRNNNEFIEVIKKTKII